MNKRTRNTILPIAIILISLVATFTFLYNQNSDVTVQPRNYKAEVLLGITPNMDSRQPTEKDIDTQLNLQTQDGSIYRLFESRDMISYGKTFVVKIA